MAVYDVFVFNNEFELLLTRLIEHDPYVDKFILIQGDRTFTGVSKPLHYPNEDSRFEAFKNKIVTINVALKADPKSPWENELQQRNISFSCVNYRADDVVFLSDVDEIVSRKHWPHLLQRIKKEQTPIAVWVELFNFYINYRLIEAMWIQPKMLLGKHFLNGGKTANEFRVDYSLPKTPEPYGWHFSYIMTEKQIQDKLNAFSHQELNRPIFNDLKKIHDQLKKRRDPFKRGLRFETVKVTDSWPIGMLENPYWKQFVCSTEPPENSLTDFIEDHWFWSKEFIRIRKDKLKTWVKSLLLSHEERL